jgi:hypothetical protein
MVMAAPGDELAAWAGGRGHLRASHADRERVIGILKAAFVQGMLGKDDFDLRVAQTFASRTYAELAAVIADLPAGLARASAAAPARPHHRQPVVRPGRVLAAATAVHIGVWGYVLLLSPHEGDNSSAPSLILVSALIYLGFLLICVPAMVALRREKSSGGQPPRRPARGPAGPASRRCTGPAHQDRRLHPGYHGHHCHHCSSQAGRGRLCRPIRVSG